MRMMISTRMMTLSVTVTAMINTEFDDSPDDDLFSDSLSEDAVVYPTHTHQT